MKKMVGAVMYWKSNFAINFFVFIVFLLWVCCFSIAANAKAAYCEKVQYEFKYERLDSKLDSTMARMIALYKRREYSELEGLYLTHVGSSTYVLENFIGAVNKRLKKSDPYVHLNSRYRKISYSIESALIAALSLSNGLAFQRYGKDMTLEEVLHEWVNDNDPDHILYAAQVRSSVHFGGWRSPKERLVYGSTLGQLLYMRDDLNQKVADKYIDEVKQAINELEPLVKAKNYGYADTVLSILRQCNSRQ